MKSLIFSESELFVVVVVVALSRKQIVISANKNKVAQINFGIVEL